jgi:hypothetical protein
LGSTSRSSHLRDQLDLDTRAQRNLRHAKGAACVQAPPRGLFAARGASAAELYATWSGLTRRSAAATYDSISAAWRAVTEQAKPGERILVVGSFVTVGEVLGVIEQGIG